MGALQLNMEQPPTCSPILSMSIHSDLSLRRPSYPQLDEIAQAGFDRFTGGGKSETIRMTAAQSDMMT